MTFRDDSKLDPSQVQDARGGGYAGPLIVGGGGIGLLILIASLLLGVDPYAGNDPAAGPLEGAPSVQECRTGADANRRADCRIVGFVDSIQKYWSDEFDRRGDTYLPATTVIYTGSVAAGCGIASGAAGPFYCPTDGKVYLDLSFFDDLRARFGARGGPFAEAYVVAHEYGHHVQDLLGLLERGGGQRGPRSGSVRVELQADFLAGPLRTRRSHRRSTRPPRSATTGSSERLRGASCRSNGRTARRRSASSGSAPVIRPAISISATRLRCSPALAPACDRRPYRTGQFSKTRLRRISYPLRRQSRSERSAFGT